MIHELCLLTVTDSIRAFLFLVTAWQCNVKNYIYYTVKLLLISRMDKIHNGHVMNVTDPSGTFTHTCPLFPLISKFALWFPLGCPLVFQSPLVRVSTCGVFWVFVPLWIAQMITCLVPCVNYCARVLFIRGTLRSFVWVSTLCVVDVFNWSSSPCLYMARRNLGTIKKTITHSCICLPINYTNVTMNNHC